MVHNSAFRTVFGISVLVFAAALALAPATGAGRAATPAPAAQAAGCDVNGQAPSPQSFPCEQGNAPAGQTDQARPPRHGYCRCSCGYPCQTSADCGGASCDKFITCC
jgi:hypothetical protein